MWASTLLEKIINESSGPVDWHTIRSGPDFDILIVTTVVHRAAVVVTKGSAPHRTNSHAHFERYGVYINHLRRKLLRRNMVNANKWNPFLAASFLFFVLPVWVFQRWSSEMFCWSPFFFSGLCVWGNTIIMPGKCSRVTVRHTKPKLAQDTCVWIVTRAFLSGPYSTPLERRFHHLSTTFRWYTTIAPVVFRASSRHPRITTKKTHRHSNNLGSRRVVPRKMVSLVSTPGRPYSACIYVPQKRASLVSTPSRPYSACIYVKKISRFIDRLPIKWH